MTDNYDTEITARYNITIAELFPPEEPTAPSIIDRICEQPDLNTRLELTEEEKATVVRVYYAFYDLNFLETERHETCSELSQKLDRLFQIPEIWATKRLKDDIAKAIIYARYKTDFDFYRDMKDVIMDWMKLAYYFRKIIFKTEAR